MAQQQSTATWQNIDPASLPEDLAKHYAAYKAAYAEMKSARETFEEEMREALRSQTPRGKRIVFGYNFGKLSIACVEDDAKPASTASATSFANLLRKG